MSRANIPNLEILDPLSGRDPLWEMDPLPGLTYIYIYILYIYIYIYIYICHRAHLTHNIRSASALPVVGESVHLSRASGVKRPSSARSANARATPCWTAS